jgi:hypothetical protein
MCFRTGFLLMLDYIKSLGRIDKECARTASDAAEGKKCLGFTRKPDFL